MPEGEHRPPSALVTPACAWAHGGRAPALNGRERAPRALGAGLGAARAGAGAVEAALLREVGREVTVSGSGIPGLALLDRLDLGRRMQLVLCLVVQLSLHHRIDRQGRGVCRPGLGWGRVSRLVFRQVWRLVWSMVQGLMPGAECVWAGA